MVAAAIANIGLDLANWMFAFKYYETSKVIPFAVRKTKVPDDLKQRLATLYKVLFIVNLVVPIFQGLLDGISSIITEKYQEFIYVALVISVFLIVISEAVSAVYLGLAINSIRKFVNGSITEHEVSTN